MNTTDLHNLQPAILAVAPRPKAATTPAVAAACTGTAPYAKTTIGIDGSWLATSRLSMTVPAFHDRRPLCST